MAEQVARVKILAQIEGLEGFDKLKGAFKGLQSAIGPSDKALSKARREVLAFGQAGARTEAVIRGQIEALRGLQGQAVVGGTVYKQLAKDIQSLSGAYKEAANSVKQLSDAQLKTQKPGAKTSTFGPQIALLKEELAELSVYSAQYTEKLTQIQRRELPFNLATGRQSVIAAFEAYRQGPELANAATRMPELPDTTAALNQRMSELAARLANVSRGGERWIQTSREMAQIQRELNREFANPAVDAARRRLERSRATGSGFLEFSQGLEDRLAVERSIERNRRKREAEAAARSGPMQGPPAPSELFRSIAGISNQTAANQIQLMGRSYREVADSIRQTAAASDGSVNSLRSQRAAWESLRNSLGDNKAALKEVNRELANIDSRLEKRTGGGNALGNRFQTLGAVASGAVFGGPAGFLGAAGGAALGASTGIGSFAGALGGAAAGAAVGGIGMAAAGASNYAAEIARLQIALKGVSTNQAEFNNSLKFIKDSAPQFLTSLGDATKNYTRLQASVRGAGLGVDETQKVFRGLSSAIVATGGGTEQLNAAMLAASQVFSKGKVSAEELRGQIGERLPGAFTIFAQAVNMTPQQLDKALQDGKVSTEDFVKFSEELFKRYGKAAQSIGDSPFAASIRFQLAMDNFRLAAGQALLPTVSFFQSLGTEALNALTRVAEGQTAWQQSIAATFDWIGKLIGGVEGLNRILGGLIKTMIVLGGVQAGLFVVSNLTAFSNGIKSIIGFTKTFLELSKALLKVETARAAINAVIAGLSTGAARGKIVGAIFGLVGGGLAAAGLSTFVDAIVNNITGSIEKATKMPNLGGNFGGTPNPVPQGPTPASEQDLERVRKQALQDQTELNRLLQEQVRLNFEAGVIGKSDLERLDAEQILLKQITRLKIDEATLTSENERNRQQRIINITKEYQKEKARIEEERRAVLQEIQDISKEADALISKFDQRSIKTESPLQKELQSVNNVIQDSIKNADELLKRLNKRGGTTAATAAERTRLGNFKESQLGMSQEDRTRLATSNLLNNDILGLQSEITNLQLFGRELTTLEQLKQKYLADWDKLDPILRQQLETLALQKDALEQNARIVDSIVNPLAQGLTSVFDALTNGTQSWGNSLREIAATVLKDIARQLLQILVIEQLISIARGALGGLFRGGGGSGGLNITDALKYSAPLPNAMGNAFGKNNIIPFAMGGIVNKPTLFKFANGGAGQLGLMGEAGPEAIMPLRRGRDGKLGVVAAGGGAPVTVNVSVDASGSQVQGNAGQGEQLGRAVAQAVQAELIKQKRPGGLLAA